MMDLQQMQQLSRRLRIVLAVVLLAALGLVGWYRYQDQQAEESARQRAEALRIQRVMIEAGEHAHQAWLNHTSPQQRKAETDAMMAQFRANENEMLTNQTMTLRAREALRAGNQSSLADPAIVQSGSVTIGSTNEVSKVPQR
jgi:predicted negative regulator of RcsB-dependent stress response